MSIEYLEENRVFHLSTNKTSYIMQIFSNGYLMHVYWGKRIHSPRRRRLKTIEDFNSFSPNPEKYDPTFSLDNLPREYPDFGKTDFRNPAYIIEQKNGSKITEAKFHSYKIYSGKPKLEGLPATYAEETDSCETLEIKLLDKLTNIFIILIYTVNEKYDVITRSVRFENKGESKVVLDTALSMNIDFYNDNKFDLIHLHGSWARERHLGRVPIGMSTHVIDSKRGSSSHQQNPFIALARKNATDHQGEVYGFSLVYSGNFKALVEVNPYKITRVQMGINDFNFKWNLLPNSSFQTPEVVMVYSDEGFNKMSQIYHKLYRERLCRGTYKDKERPILINNWEATYFYFTEDKIKEIAKIGSDLGIELFVLDDGWFGERNSDRSSLGDWYVNKSKLPNGLDGIGKYINSLGMKFGLWFEPEMISVNSNLYKEHPDWCLHIPQRNRSEGRNQLVLDLSREEVCDYIINTICNVLDSAPIEYVKWDMNRNMTEVGSLNLPSENQGEVYHRYILGLYRILEVLTTKYPNILFESCSGGGGRFDPGMLYYMPQTWTSDNTDAYERLFIQYGTSFVYPPITMGAHVSEVPNHQVGRITSLKTRGNIAMSANFGYELDLTKLSEKDYDEIKEQIQKYKKIRKDIQFGTFYRLLSPYDYKEAAFMIISEDENRVYVFYYQTLKEPNVAARTLKLVGLKEDKKYKCVNTKEEYYGDELMYMGFDIPHLYGDFASVLLEFQVV